jgi:hypothetical protein
MTGASRPFRVFGSAACETVPNPGESFDLPTHYDRAAMTSSRSLARPVQGHDITRRSR